MYVYTFFYDIIIFDLFNLIWIYDLYLGPDSIVIIRCIINTRLLTLQYKLIVEKK